MPSRVSPPPRPDSLNLEQLFSAIPWWHQRWEIFKDVFTPGRNPVEQLMSEAGVPRDLTGKRVLDVGAFNCCCSFECERRGAAEVIALDLQRPEDLGFPLIRDAIQSSRVRFMQGSVYDLNPAMLGEFDVVIFFGVLYHLRYPLLAIDQLRKILRGTVYIESLVIDHRFLVRGQDFQELASYHEVLTEIPIWQFYKGNELAGDHSNWFGPNIRAVVDAFQSAGLTTSLTSTWGDRAAFQATTGGVDTIQKSYEGMSGIVAKEVDLRER